MLVSDDIAFWQLYRLGSARNMSLKTRQVDVVTKRVVRGEYRLDVRLLEAVRRGAEVLHGVGS
jgi:hypothetical protein